MTYHDLRSVREFQDKTILAVKAPPDTVLTCDAQEVCECVCVSVCVCVMSGTIGRAFAIMWISVYNYGSI